MTPTTATSSAPVPTGAEAPVSPVEVLDDRDLLAEHRIRRARLLGATCRGAAPAASSATWRQTVGGLVLCAAVLGGTGVAAAVRHHLPGDGPDRASTGQTRGAAGEPVEQPAPPAMEGTDGTPAPAAEDSVRQDAGPGTLEPSAVPSPDAPAQPYGTWDQNLSQSSR